MELCWGFLSARGADAIVECLPGTGEVAAAVAVAEKPGPAIARILGLIFAAYT
jgi:hypothetical protein